MAAELFDSVVPRPEVLAGALTDAVFAASLDEVVAGTAPDAYGDASEFFAATYPSAGLRSLLDEVLGRLGGGRPNGAPVVRVETNLGGGKTHNLIALFHAANRSIDASVVGEFMDPANLPTEPVAQIGVFVGTSSGATNFPEVAGTKARTPWGYLALQLGGVDSYEKVRVDDEGLTAPGAHDLGEILGGRPSLILIDEIARYLAVADGHAVARSTLAEQTSAFLMALMEAVGSQPNAALVITTTQVTDAFGDQTARVLEATAQAQSLIARKEHVLRPSEEADLPRILARRLFSSLSPGAAATVAARYSEAAADAYKTGADLPESMTSPGFEAEVARCFPFHPDLITVLDKRLSTIPNFQRTRGALRLLARAVRRMWDERPAGTLAIHLHHIDLADKDIVEDLSSRLDKGTFEPVIRADIASQPGLEPSHAEQVDARMGSSFARKLATTAYLFSLTRDVPGVPASTLFGAVLSPGDDCNVMDKALTNLDASAWYLHTDARGYRFSVEASLAKLVQEAAGRITVGKVKAEARDILAEQFRDSALKVRRTWEDAKIPDRDDDAWLVVLHWDEFGGSSGVDDSSQVPAQITELWEKTPTGGVREYRNRLVFLAPLGGSHDAMLRAVRNRLALKELAESTETTRSLGDDKRRELTDRAKSSAMEARVAVCNHVNLLYVPQKGGLEPVELDTVTNASVKPNQTDAVVERLSAMEKTLAAGDKPLDPGWIRRALGAQLDKPLSTLELVRVFARRADLKLVLDRAQISALVSAGVRNGVWEYHDAEKGTAGWSTRDRPDVSVRLADDTSINPVGSAPEPEPVGGAAPLLPKLGGAGSAGVLGAGVAGTASIAQFEGFGKADVAVQAARQGAVDAGTDVVARVLVSIDEIGSGTGTQLAKLLTIVPSSTPGATVRYEISVTAQLGAPTDVARVEFSGSPAEYQPLKSGVDNVLRAHDAVVKATVDARFDRPLEVSGQAVEELLGRARDTGPAKCSVRFLAAQDTKP